MKKDIILAGVGGQGILSIAAVIDWAALKSGLQIKQAEVHGMSQRGGAVQSHLRISDQIIYSDLISKGNADIIISIEPLETLRYLTYLAKDGWIITSSNPFKNIPNYPSEEELMKELSGLQKAKIIDAEKIARSCGNVKTSNMVILGASSQFIEIEKKFLIEGIKALFSNKGEDIIAMNIKAFESGFDNLQNE
jgi:indolepyruvate ferredoxin oxidoreductase, beta subunit